jgi:hypothetical protein
MPDNRMFSQLMDPQTTPEPQVSVSKKQITKHVSLHLTEAQVAVIDRYFTLFYARDPRPTRGAIVGVALEMLDDVLRGHTPEIFDRTLLADYARRHAGTQAGTQAGAEAPKHRGAYEP